MCDQAADSSVAIRGQMVHMEDLMGYFKVDAVAEDMPTQPTGEEEVTACGVTIKPVAADDQTDQGSDV
jgi:hypothetical protein